MSVWLERRAIKLKVEVQFPVVNEVIALELEMEIQVSLATVIYAVLKLQSNEPDIDPMERLLWYQIQKYCKTSQHTINAIKN